MKFFEAVTKLVESAEGDTIDLGKCWQLARAAGREAGWVITDDLQEEFEKLFALHYLAGMCEEPLENAPRYATFNLEFPDMTLTIMACRPLGTTPLVQYETIRKMCADAGWDVKEMSISEFIQALIRRSVFATPEDK